MNDPFVEGNSIRDDQSSNSENSDSEENIENKNSWKISNEEEKKF